MLNNRNAILIGSNIATLTLLTESIRSIEPELRCISFVYADEASEVILHELKHAPEYIFVDADTARISGAAFLKRLHTWRLSNACCIVVFANVMPGAVAEAYKTKGADFAFQMPLTEPDMVQELTPLLKPQDHQPQLTDA